MNVAELIAKAITYILIFTTVVCALAAVFYFAKAYL